MSQYTQEQETEIVRDAMYLTAAIQTEKAELERLKGERFRSRPSAPQRKTLPKPEPVRVLYPPKPRTSYSFGTFLKEFFAKNKKWFYIGGGALIALIVLTVIISAATKSDNPYAAGFTLAPLISFLVFAGAGAFFVVMLIQFKKQRNAMNRELEKTPEYQKAVKDAEAQAAARQKEAEEKHAAEQEKLDREYEAAQKKYETEIIPAYEKEASQWETAHQKKIRMIEEDLENNRDLLGRLYDTTRILSLTYRELPTLEWLYGDMSTSDHDIRYATELYDRDRQRQVTKDVSSSVDEMNRNMMQGFQAVYGAIEEGNELQEETNSILANTRRDMNLGHIALGLQNKKSNKLLTDILDSVKK